MRAYNYILDEHNRPVAEPDVIKWATWFETANRRVAHDIIGDSKVSTVFLSIDHSWGSGPPILWETMVFGGPLNHEQDRCAGSKEQAEAMHQAMVERVYASSNANRRRQDIQ